MRRLARAGLAAAGGAALWLAVSGTVAHHLTRRPRAPFAEPVPAALAEVLEPLRLVAADGVELGAWWHAPAPGAATAVLLHGLGGARSGYAPLAEHLAARGHGVLALSLRAHGDSAGDHLDFGWSARHDVAAAVAACRERAPASPVALVGTSLGAAAALYAVDGSLEVGGGLAVEGLLLEAPYRDLERATRLRLAAALPAGFDTLAWWGMRPFAEACLGVDPATLQPLAAARRLPADLPVRFAFGALDPYAPPEDRASFGGETLPGVGHDGEWAVDRGSYTQRVAAFLDGLAPPGPEGTP